MPDKLHLPELPASDLTLMVSVWCVAYPMILSTASSTVIIFSDRLFLSWLSKEAMAASMPAGVTAFMLSAFFIGVLNYVNALVGQYFGAGEPENCARAAWQGLIFAGFSWLVILALIWPCIRFLAFFAPPPEVLHLEIRFFTILSAGSLFSLAASALSGFFAGLGETRTVMVGNMLGMAVNVPFNLLLIFGLPENPWLRFDGWGVSGAAFASVLAMAVSFGYFWWRFQGADRRARFGTLRVAGFDRPVFAKLLRFGVPSGFEFLLNIAAFNLFVLMIGGLGLDEQVAVNITFSWNLIAFLPLVGISIAVTALVGQRMGRGDPHGAERVTYAAMKIAYLYIAFMACLFVFAPELLVDVFSGGARPEYAAARPLACQLLQLAAVYAVTDALCLSCEGALRGSGDTRFVLVSSAFLHWFMLVIPTWFFLHRLHLGAVQLWCWFIAFAVTVSLVFFLRFRGGRWKLIRVVDADAHDPGCPMPVAGEQGQMDV